MLLDNLFTEDGLYNGALGCVIDIVYSQEAHNEIEHFLVRKIHM